MNPSPLLRLDDPKVLKKHLGMRSKDAQLYRDLVGRDYEEGQGIIFSCATASIAIFNRKAFKPFLGQVAIATDNAGLCFLDTKGLYYVDGNWWWARPNAKQAHILAHKLDDEGHRMWWLTQLEAAVDRCRRSVEPALWTRDHQAKETELWRQFNQQLSRWDLNEHTFILAMADFYERQQSAAAAARIAAAQEVARQGE